MIDVLDPSFAADPGPALHALRARGPIVFDPAWAGWHVTGYAEVDAALRHPHLGCNRPLRLARIEEQGHRDAALAYLSNRLDAWDAPEHTPLRAAVSTPFSPRRTAALESFITETAGELVDSCPRDEPFDLMAAVLHPLPSLVISELLGVPEEDRRLFDGWASATARLIGGTRSADLLAQAQRDVEREWAHVEHLIETRTAAPEDDLLSAMCASDLPHDVLVANVIFLFSAGHHTTRDAMASGLLAMLRDRSQWERLVDDPTLAASAAEESLRHDPPVPTVYRRALVDTELCGERVAAGTDVYCWVHAANHDPARFDTPDAFVTDRADNRPLTFGGGLHHCVGAMLARLELRVVYALLAARAPRLSLVSEDVAWRDTIGFRGPVSLVVTR